MMAKHGLRKHGFKDQKLVSCGRGANREERRRLEEEGGIKAKKVWNFGFLYGINLGYGFYYGSYEFCMRF